MNISEKAAYLQGLADGLALDKDSKEGKLFAAVIDLLGDMAEELESLNDAVDELGDGLDAISDDLEDVEDYLFDDEDDDDDDEDDEWDDEDEDEDDECCCGCGCEDDECCPVLYTLTCPSCENEITIDEDVLELGSINCPNCNELLEFDIEEECDDECCCGEDKE